MKNSEEQEAGEDSSLEIRNSNFEIHWPRLYAFVLAELVITIIIFTIFTKVFA